MAEKYGTIPKKFTYAWWGYFWTYYKWYVIALTVIIILIIGTITTNIKMGRYDLTLTYAGPQYLSAPQQKEVAAEFSQLCPDVNEDDKQKLSFANLTMNPDSTDMEYLSSAVTMLQFSLYNEEKYVYIVHKEFLPRFLGQNAASCAFAPVEDWLKADVGDAEMISKHGNDYGVSLEGSKLLDKWGIDLTDHYLVVRFAPRQVDKPSEYELHVYDCAVEFANKLLEQ